MLQKFEEDLNIIQKLADRPNADDGMTAAALKAKFDESGLTTQEYLNDTLVETLNTDAANNLGIGSIEGFSECVTVADALRQLQSSAERSISEQIPNESITPSKLQKRDVDGYGGITSLNIAVGGVETINIADHHVTNPKLSRKVDPAGAAVNTENIRASAVTSVELADGAVTNAKVASISGSKITNGSIPAGKFAAGAIKGSDIAAGAIKAENIQDGAITFSKVQATGFQPKIIAKQIVLEKSLTTWRKAVSGITANSNIIAGYAPDTTSMDNWNNNQIYCSGQESGYITFTARGGAPSTATNVVVFAFN